MRTKEDKIIYIIDLVEFIARDCNRLKSIGEFNKENREILYDKLEMEIINT